MKAIVCEMCGSQDLVKKDGFYICQNCGTKYDPEEAKKLLIDISGSKIEIDNSTKIENLYTLARRARDNNDVQQAANFYNQILTENPLGWEASFFAAYYNAIQAKVANIENTTYALFNTVLTSANLAYNELERDSEKTLAAVKLILLYTNNYAESVFNTVEKALLDHCRAFWGNISETYYKDQEKRITSLYDALDQLGDALYESDVIKPLCILPYKEKLRLVYKFDDDYKAFCAEGHPYAKYTQIPLTERNKLISERIKEYDSSYIPPFEKNKTDSQKSGCYVATAVYGSYDCPQVWTLRRYRDYTLAEIWYGRAFIRTYYAISPTIVKWFGETEWFKNMWKPKLDRMVKDLNEKGIADTPYQDRNW